MSHLDPIGYTYEADVHCVPCALHRFGRTPEGWVPEYAMDTESNRVGAIFSYDDTTSDDGRGYHCGTCHERITDDWCAVCDESGEHTAEDHEIIVQRDTGRDTVTGMTSTVLIDTDVILTSDDAPCDNATLTECMRRVSDLRDQWLAYTDDERDEHAAEVWDDASDILTDAGYIVDLCGDQGTWTVYGPVAEYRATCGSIRPHSGHAMPARTVDGPLGRTTTVCVGNIGDLVTETR